MIKPHTAKKLARIVALLLAALMVIGVLSEVVLTSATAADSMSSLKSQLAAKQQEQKEIQSEIDSLDEKVASASDRKAALDRQITAAIGEIETVQQLIAALDQQITQKEEELEAAIAKMEEQEALFKTRARVLYECNDTSYLGVLLGAEDLTDMISRMEIVSQFNQYDNELLDEYTAAKEEVERQKASLEADRQEQAGYKAQLESKKASLEQQQAESQAIIESLKEDKSALVSEYNKIGEEQEQIQSEISALSKKLAEEAAAKAAAAKSSVSSKNTGSSSTATESGSKGWVWPVAGYHTISSPFGMRKHPITGIYKLHDGMDIAVPSGVPIKAAKGGTVVKSYFNTAYGNYIVIDHGNGVQTGYAHMSSRVVSVGTKVSAGQLIGYVGSTGWSTGAHLHLQFIVNGSFTNPANYY
ncbi:MAG: murein hydrolase activator EnvC family protein [Butyricicoccaceae bacterium]